MSGMRTCSPAAPIGVGHDSGSTCSIGAVVGMVSPLRVLLSAAALVLALFGLAAALPRTAAALPDSRIYEQVSPADKDGNVILPNPDFSSGLTVSLGSEEGNAVEFASSGAVGHETNQGGLQENISRRIPGVGWVTTPADSRQVSSTFGFIHSPQYPSFYPNRSFSKVFFDSHSLPWTYEVAFSLEEPGSGNDTKLYLSENPFEPAIWVGKPTAKNPIPALGGAQGCSCVTSEPSLPLFNVEGVSPDGSTIYFTSSGTLLPEDEGPGSRSEHVSTGNLQGPSDSWGFYEWHDGTLNEAGTLPNGKLSPYGSVAASLAGVGRYVREEKVQEAERGDNQVSESGNDAFFVSPDPGTGGESAIPAELPQLYVRETLPSGEHKSVLVSRDEQLPDVKEENSEGTEGEYPAPAPAGVVPFARAQGLETGQYQEEDTYSFASPDGSHVFFASADKLTPSTPTQAEWELYLGEAYTGGTFELSVSVNKEAAQTTAPIPFGASTTQVQSALEALANVGAGNVTVEGGKYPGPPHSYTMHFLNEEPSLVDELAGLTGEAYNYLNNITPPNLYDFDVETEKLTYLPDVHGEIAASSQNGSRIMFVSGNSGERKLELWEEGGKIEKITNLDNLDVTPARASNNGNAWLFMAESSPGEALSQFNNGGRKQFYRYYVPTKELVCVSCAPRGVVTTAEPEANLDSYMRSIQPIRLMSADGTRVFFGTQTPLVGAAVNGQINVYEWENGNVYLISGGTAVVESRFLDSSETGGDVFFTTAQGLVPSEEAEETNVYDARIPRPGDNPPPNQTPCSGEVCLGPPSVPQLLTPAASAAFEGLGNIPPEAEEKPVTTKIKQTTKKAKKKVKKKKAKGKAKKKAKKSNRRGK